MCGCLCVLMSFCWCLSFIVIFSSSGSCSLMILLVLFMSDGFMGLMILCSLSMCLLGCSFISIFLDVCSCLLLMFLLFYGCVSSYCLWSLMSCLLSGSGSWLCWLSSDLLMSFFVVCFILFLFLFCCMVL